MDTPTRLCHIMKKLDVVVVAHRQLISTVFSWILELFIQGTMEINTHEAKKSMVSTPNRQD